MTWSSTVVEKCDFCGWGSTRGIDVAKPDVLDWSPLVCMCLIQIVLLYCSMKNLQLPYISSLMLVRISYVGEIFK